MKKEKMKTVELFPLINVFVTTMAEFVLETLTNSLPPLVNVPFFFFF